MPEVESIAVRFAEAIEFLRGRLQISDEEWRRLLAAADIAAAKAADATEEAMRRDFRAAVLRAMEEGRTARSFRDDYDRIVAEHGWSYRGDAGWHSDLVFRMETANARAAGRWAQVQRTKASRPYLLYETAGDRRVRPEHRQWQGVVLPVDHPWWRTHWPPNGFNCRCYIRSLSERDLVRYGLQVTPSSDEMLSIPPDPGFAGNIGMAWDEWRAGA